MKTNKVVFLLCAFLAGAFTRVNAASGDVDLTFDPGSGVNGFVRAVAVQPDGKVLIGGDFTTVHARMCTALARLNADGSVDMTFASKIAGTVSSWPPTPSVSSVAVQADGKILIGGYFTTVSGVARE